MLKKILCAIGVVLLITLVSGCNNDKGSDFVGRWSSGNHDAKGLAPPSYYLDIKRDNDIYHVDVQANIYDFISGGRKITSKKYEAKAESETVLSMMGGMLTMRLENERLFFGNDEFIKLK
ncbi:hypothetical protein JH25_27830 [Pseudomonas sp. BRG-100]|uniref:hypothetical protein n=1 Tax=Pseudomonas sp. BRG-100 TaxID=1524267 RepID=UPI0004E61475|nr:hypothetical protein [Pseudomonas sp. BRG-100]KFF42179.1 hypothetical protein JH25_27830 [Pseudomonas sp. BRG-100]